jgi:hypothetical protein
MSGLFLIIGLIFRVFPPEDDVDPRGTIPASMKEQIATVVANALQSLLPNDFRDRFDRMETAVKEIRQSQVAQESLQLDPNFDPMTLGVTIPLTTRAEILKLDAELKDTKKRENLVRSEFLYSETMLPILKLPFKREWGFSY